MTTDDGSIRRPKYPDPAAGLIWESDLEYYDGPLLSVYRNQKNEPFLDIWVDFDPDNGETRLLFRTTEVRLDAYCNNKITFLQLLMYCEDGFVWISRWKEMGTRIESELVQARHIPEHLLPGDVLRHPRDAESENDVAAITKHPEGRAYTPEQKRKVIEDVLEVWLEKPELRLGQLIANAISEPGKDKAQIFSSIFNVEDDVLVQKLQK